MIEPEFVAVVRLRPNVVYMLPTPSQRHLPGDCSLEFSNCDLLKSVRLGMARIGPFEAPLLCVCCTTQHHFRDYQIHFMN